MRIGDKMQNMSIKFEAMRNATRDDWFCGVTWENAEQHKRSARCNCELEEISSWMKTITDQIDSGKLKGNPA